MSFLCCISWSKSIRKLFNCPISEICQMHLRHHEWDHKECLTWTILQRILILYCLQILSLASTFYQNETNVEQLGVLGGTGTYSVPLRASTPSRNWGFQAPEIVEAKEDVVHMCEKWYDYTQPGWCQPVRQEFMENECEVLPGVAYPRVRDNRSTINTKTGYDDDDDVHRLQGGPLFSAPLCILAQCMRWCIMCQNLLPAANVLQLFEVQDACCEFLRSQLHPSNCLGINAFADLHACMDLSEYTQMYIEQHFRLLLIVIDIRVTAFLSLCTQYSEKEHPLLFCCITLRKSNQFEWELQTK